MDLSEILSMWDQAGERPYIVLQDHGVYDDFLAYLDASEIYLVKPLYRGTLRHGKLQAGDILDYTHYPTSWSQSETISSYFVDGMSNSVILQLVSDLPVRGISNTQNTFGEEEVILAPQRLKVIRSDQMSNYIKLTVIPLFEKAISSSLPKLTYRSPPSMSSASNWILYEPQPSSKPVPLGAVERNSHKMLVMGIYRTLEEAEVKREECLMYHVYEMGENINLEIEEQVVGVDLWLSQSGPIRYYRM